MGRKNDVALALFFFFLLVCLLFACFVFCFLFLFFFFFVSPRRVVTPPSLSLSLLSLYDCELLLQLLFDPLVYLRHSPSLSLFFFFLFFFGNSTQLNQLGACGIYIQKKKKSALLLFITILEVKENRAELP